MNAWQSWLMITGLSFVLAHGWLVFGWHRGWKRTCAEPHSSLAEDALPMISVIVAFRNEEKHLPALTAALAAQDYPASRMEVILADDHSEDRGPSVADSWRRQSPFQVRILSPPMGHGKKAALRAGMAVAEGELILFTDADCIMGPGWIRSMAAAALKKGSVMVLGPVVLEKLPGFPASFQQQEMAALQAVTAGSAGNGRAFLGNGANLLVRRDALAGTMGSVRGTRHASGDDVFLVQAVRKRAGGTAVVFQSATEAIVRTKPLRGPVSLLRQRIRWSSKSYAYRDHYAGSVSAFFLLLHVVLLVLQLIVVLHPSLLPAVLVLLTVKAALDYHLAGVMIVHTRQERKIGDFLLIQLCYPAYVCLVALLGWYPFYRWKGRKVR